MKRILGVLVLLAFVYNTSASNKETNQSEQQSEVKQVEVYYFHGDRRCETCKAVGSVSKSLIEKKYGENTQVKFVDINIDREENKAIAEKFKVTGSSLIVYNGDKPVNITALAFQYALVNPDKLKNKLIQLIDRNLN